MAIVNATLNQIDLIRVFLLYQNTTSATKYIYAVRFGTLLTRQLSSKLHGSSRIRYACF